MKPCGGRVPACETHLCHVGKKVEHSPLGEECEITETLPSAPPLLCPLTHFRELLGNYEMCTLRVLKERGPAPCCVHPPPEHPDQQAHAHHQKTQTTRCAPAAGGPQSPAQRLPLDPRVVISFLLFLLLLFLWLSQHIRVMLL